MTYLEFRRRQLGLSQSALGRLVSMRQNWISYAEIGRVNLTSDERQRLARVLSVPAEKLTEKVPDALLDLPTAAPLLEQQA